MRGVVLAAAAIVAANLWLPGQAAEPTAPTVEPAPQAANDATITFEDYRDWRMHFIERRQTQLAMQLAAADLPAARKARLEQVKAYYDWLAGLPETERDQRFRERFDQIDTNHDGKIDAAERAAWREKQRIFYRRDAAARRQPPAAEPETH